MQRLYKSNHDKVFDGVCGGIGEYLNVDPVMIRLFWILLVIFGGSGIVAYLVAMFIIPKRPSEVPEEVIEPTRTVRVVVVSNRLWGMILVIAGLLLLMAFIGPLQGFFMGITAFMGHGFWPLVVIGLGLYLFFNSQGSGNVRAAIEEVFPPDQKLQRSRTDRKLTGVCGGIAAYFGIDSNIIRIFWAIGTLGSFGFGILAYIALSLLLTEAE